VCSCEASRLGRGLNEYFYLIRYGDSVVVNQALGFIWVLLAEQLQGGGVVGIIRKFLLVIQQPLKLFCEMTHLAFVVLRQGLEELLLILLNVIVNRFHDWNCHLADTRLLAETSPIDHPVDLPLSPKAHN